MENNNISKAIRSILEEGQAVTVKHVLEALRERNIEAEYRPVFGTLRRISNNAGKGTFQGFKKASKAETIVEAPVAEIEEAVVAVEEAPMKKAAKRKRKK
jgi:uncharacterized protein YqgV (UPF0045/DUF77 family)